MATCSRAVAWRESLLTRACPAIANGCYFNIGARLARYTHNKTYADHADQTWDWLWGTGYIDNKSWRVYDGAHVDRNCTDINKATFSYNIAVLLQGAAFMYNFVGDSPWPLSGNGGD